MRATMKRQTTHIGRRRPRRAELQQHTAPGGAFAHHMPTVVGQIQRVIDVNMQAVWTRILTLTPGAQKVAIPIKHDHRMRATVKNVDLIPTVGADRGNVTKLPAIGQFRPVFDHLVTMLTSAQNDGHTPLPVLCCCLVLQQAVRPLARNVSPDIFQHTGNVHLPVTLRRAARHMR